MSKQKIQTSITAFCLFALPVVANAATSSSIDPATVGSGALGSIIAGIVLWLLGIPN